MENYEKQSGVHIKPEVPLAASIALLFVVGVFFTRNLALLDIELHYRLIFICAEILILLNIGMLITREYHLDEHGLTVTWFGFIKHKYQWNFFKEVGVYILLSTYGRAPFIVCSKIPWPKKIMISDLSFFFPFSCFFIDFTPKRFDVIKKFGVDIAYYSRREKVIDLYLQAREKNSNF